jgi:hypothetical protein
MAELISFDAARARFADRIAQRALRMQTIPDAACVVADRCEEPSFDFDAFSEQLRARWNAEADTWPRAFRGPARSRIAHWTHPGELYRRRRRTADDQGVDPIEEYRSGRRRGSNFDTFPGTLEVLRGEGFHEITVRLVRLIRAHAAELRRRRAVHGPNGSPNGWVGRQRMTLEAAKSDLLAHLWLHDRRSIQRQDFESSARSAVADDLRKTAREIDALREANRKSRATLRGGVRAGGYQKGEPISDVGRQQTRTRIRNRKARMVELEARLVMLETEPDPLVAWGLYVRVHRAPEVEA